jgi:GNAT superfamily N-acetyltransferase
MVDPRDPLIRRATVADAVAIAGVHARSWQAAYVDLLPQEVIDDMLAGTNRRIERLRGQLSAPSAVRIWVADQAGKVAGFAIVGPPMDPAVPLGTGEVHAIYLAPEAWDRGIGRALFSRAVQDLEDTGSERAILWVLTSNARARRFYEAAGWQADGATKVEERPGGSMDEVRYWRPLGDADS